ncbi:XrtN system VIT domain-containing protein [Chitinophagaceae bacterium MMS25-I14]
MSEINSPVRDNVYQTGIIAIILSLIIFCIPVLSGTDMRDTMGVFMLNYIITVLYFFTLLFSGRLRKKKGSIHHFIVFLILFLISAYSLNRNMNVFEDSVDWLSVLLWLSCLSFCSFGIYDRLPKSIRLFSWFVLGIATMLFLYLSVYLLPLYPISVPLALGLGLSLHTFVPLLFVVTSIRLVIQNKASGNTYRIAYFSGVTICIFITVSYAIVWASTNKKINKSYYSRISAENDLPGWVNAAMHIPPGNTADKILKAGIVYTTVSENMNFWRIPTKAFDEKTKHDPLIVTASLFSRPTDINEDEKVKILRLRLDARHRAQERLWNGDLLETNNINTNIRIWPALHLAYTEKTITVRNNAEGGRWDREEAIYTFHLPEGSVVSSLSLWINGMEEKSVLTTKEKADTAYKTIVGVQARDPSVVHWQEGNTVSVRVFPVEAGSNRTFKLGVTTPLEANDRHIAYRNIYFEGPETKKATEQIHLMFEEPVKRVNTSIVLEASGSKQYNYSGDYIPGWDISWSAVPIQPAAFSFDSSTYTISAYTPSRNTADIRDLYLDINNSWTAEDLHDVLALSGKYNLFIYDAGLVQLDKNNIINEPEALRKLNFSMFPVFIIKDPAHSLLVSKSNDQSATLNDLKGSVFLKRLEETQPKAKINLYNIGTSLSYYLRSLREMRWFNYEHGSTEDLKTLLDKQLFAAENETDSGVIIHDAEMMITKSRGTANTQAPDHLMRLFAYNHIMQCGGSRFLTGNVPEQDSLVQEAKAAHIVTPLSSMIVLETAKDYADFNIEKSKKSLENASIKSSGSVPEPHEWALIILAIVLVIYLHRKQKTTWKA